MSMCSSGIRIGIVAFSRIASDARVLRQIQYLRRYFQISAIGYGDLPDMPDVEMLTLEPMHHSANLTASQKLTRRIRSGQLLPYFQLIAGRLFPQVAYESWYWA